MISLFCPSRGRPKAAAELLDSFLTTKALNDTHLTFCVDYDDPTRMDYPLGWTALDTPTGDPTGPLNSWALKSTSDIVGFIGDDSRFETPGWDAQVVSALRDPGFCWADDGHKIPWPSTCFASREIVQALGYFALPSLKRGFFDAVWMNLAGGVFRNGWTFPPDNCARILRQVMIRHDNSMHPVDPAVIAADEAAFNLWRATEMEADKKKVRAAVAVARFF